MGKAQSKNGYLDNTKKVGVPLFKSIQILAAPRCK
jgi:hypothetical protein